MLYKIPQKRDQGLGEHLILLDSIDTASSINGRFMATLYPTGPSVPVFQQHLLTLHFCVTVWQCSPRSQLFHYICPGDLSSVIFDVPIVIVLGPHEQSPQKIRNLISKCYVCGRTADEVEIAREQEFDSGAWKQDCIGKVSRSNFNGRGVVSCKGSGFCFFFLPSFLPYIFLRMWFPKRTPAPGEH